MKLTKILWFFTIFLAFGLTSQVWAQTGAIKGEVKDEQGNPIEGVQITIEGMNFKVSYKVETDKKGKYFHGGVRLQGLYRVIAQKEGYQPAYYEKIKPGFGATNAVEVDFQLKKGKGRLDFSITEEEKKKLREEAAKKKKAFEEMNQEFQQGRTMMDQGQYDEAIKLFNSAAAKDPKQVAIWANLALAYDKAKQYEESVGAYNKAIELSPQDPGLFQNLGNVYSSMGDTEKAKEQYEKAAEIGGATDPKAAAANYYNMGVTYINAGKNEEAAEALKKAIAADPTHSEAHYQLGIVYLGMNKMEEAVKELKTYIKLDPNGKNASVAQDLIKQLGGGQ